MPQKRKTKVERHEVVPHPSRTPRSEFPEFIGKRKTCPRCGFVGDVIKDFGIRSSGKYKPRAQSYCRSCRSSLTFGQHHN